MSGTGYLLGCFIAQEDPYVFCCLYIYIYRELHIYIYIQEYTSSKRIDVLDVSAAIRFAQPTSQAVGQQEGPLRERTKGAL